MKHGCQNIRRPNKSNNDEYSIEYFELKHEGNKISTVHSREMVIE